MRSIILAVLVLIACAAGYMAAGVGHAMMPEEPSLRNISWKRELSSTEQLTISTVFTMEEWSIEDYFLYKIAKGQRTGTEFITFIGNEQWYIVSISN